MNIINFIAMEIVGNPAILFALIALTGLILLKKPIEEIILGVAKTAIGFIILVGGVELLFSACDPLTEWVQKILDVDGVVAVDFLVLGSVMEHRGSEVGIAVVIAFALNLILARFTRYKYVAAVGHLMVNITAWIVGVLAGTNLSSGSIIITAGIVAGFYFWLTPAINHYFMRNNDNLTSEWSLFVPDVTSIAIASTFGKYIGDPSERCEDIKVPKHFKWMQDTTVGIAVVAALFWIIIGLIAGKEAVEAFSDGQNWITYLILLGAEFAGGLAIVVYGVRMLLAEIVPAFDGIATKLIPGAIVGLDYPTIFHFSPSAVFIGFVFNLFGGILATIVMMLLKFSTFVIPGVWVNFWVGSVMGVFADAYGGRRATMIISFVLGFLIPFGWALGYPLSGIIAGSGAIMDNTDAGTIGLLFEYIVEIILKK